MRRGKRYLIIATILLLGNGFRGLFDALRFHHAITLSYAQFVAQRPTAGWFHIPDARLDLQDSILSANAMTDAYYVPVVPVNDAGSAAQPDTSSPQASSAASATATTAADEDTPDVQLVAYVTDNATVRDIDAIRNAANKQATVWGMQHWSQLPPVSAAVVPDGVSGLILPDGGNNSDDARKVENNYGDGGGGELVAIHKDAHPAFFFALLQVVAGALCGIGTLWSFGINPSVSGAKAFVADRMPGQATAYRPVQTPAPSLPAASQPGPAPWRQTQPPGSGVSSPQSSLPPWATRRDNNDEQQRGGS